MPIYVHVGAYLFMWLGISRMWLFLDADIHAGDVESVQSKG